MNDDSLPVRPRAPLAERPSVESRNRRESAGDAPDEEVAPIDLTQVAGTANASVGGLLASVLPSAIDRVASDRASGDVDSARVGARRVFQTIEANRESLIAISKMKPASSMEKLLVDRAKAAVEDYAGIQPVRDSEVESPEAIRRAQLDLGSGDTYALITQREKVGGNSYFGAHTLKFANELKAAKGVEEADRYVNFATRHERFFAARNPGEAARDMGGGVGAFFGDAVKLGYALGSDTPTRDQAVELLLGLGDKFGKTPEEKTNAV
ncbi:MAG: hypothetical protein GX636_10860, partial [Actinomycetales bacterium]|nr:hypothetical protein [Actinomycetales bacterium]